MNLLIILWRFNKDNDANLSILNLIVNSFSQANKVHIISLGKFPLYFLENSNIFTHIVNYNKPYPNYHSNKNIILSRLKTWYLNFYYLVKYVCKFIEVKKSVNLSFILSVVSPFISAVILTILPTRINKILYLLDPLWKKSNSLKNKFLLFLFNLRIQAFVFSETINENVNNIYKLSYKKVFYAKIPLISPISINNLNKNNWFLYTGNLYQEIRNPEYCIKTILSLPLPSLKLTFYGNGYDINDNNGKSLFLKYKVDFHNPISKKALEVEIQDYQYLIYIGNSIDTQFSSKIYDYINTGKTIICFIKNSNDYVFKVLDKYPNKFFIHEYLYGESIATKILYDYISNSTFNVDIDIKKLYYENTPKFFTDFIQSINSKL